MREKTETRIRAEKLRREQGLSYSEISKLTGVSKSTLSAWLKEIRLSTEQMENLENKMIANRSTFAARAWMINQERFLYLRNKARQDGINVLEHVPKAQYVDELSLAMLYLGEGSKSYGRVQIASTDEQILRFFLTMLLKLYQIDKTRLCFRLNLVNIARSLEEEFINWWKKELFYPNARFIKTQYDTRSHRGTLTGDYHGVCTLTYYDTYLQQRILSLAHAYISTFKRVK
jgi:transcriptional regulator with XRE-family HTH domain